MIRCSHVGAGGKRVPMFRAAFHTGCAAGELASRAHEDARACVCVCVCVGGVTTHGGPTAAQLCA